MTAASCRILKTDFTIDPFQSAVPENHCFTRRQPPHKAAESPLQFAKKSLATHHLAFGAATGLPHLASLFQIDLNLFCQASTPYIRGRSCLETTALFRGSHQAVSRCFDGAPWTPIVAREFHAADAQCKTTRPYRTAFYDSWARNRSATWPRRSTPSPPRKACGVVCNNLMPDMMPKAAGHAEHDRRLVTIAGCSYASGGQAAGHFPPGPDVPIIPRLNLRNERSGSECFGKKGSEGSAGERKVFAGPGRQSRAILRCRV